MIPENLTKLWETEVARLEILFLADHGGGDPDALTAPSLTPTGRRVALRRMGFRVREEYDMPRNPMRPVGPDNREPWVRLTNGIAVCLDSGFVIRSAKGGSRDG